MFPSRPRSSSPAVQLPACTCRYSEFAGVRYPHWALAPAVLYPRHGPADADPKAISGRTSYLRSRLEFHPYPQVIRRFCMTDRFGPPAGFTPPSPCPRVARPVSCPTPATVGSPENLRFSGDPGRPVQTRFPYGFGCLCLSLATEVDSRAHSPKGTPSGLPLTGQRPRTVCRLAVSGSLSPPSPGCFSPFPHGTMRYRSPRVFSLGGWSPQLPTGFHVSRGTRERSTGRREAFAYGAITLSGRPFQDRSANLAFCDSLGVAAAPHGTSRNPGTT